jgi:hypothetical protein
VAHWFVEVCGKKDGAVGAVVVVVVQAGENVAHE